MSAARFVIDAPVLDRRGETAGAVLRVSRPGETSWVEFRGPAYGEWGAEEPSPAQSLHDALTGPHASVLHAGDRVVILDRHADHDAVAALVNAADGEGE